MNETRLDFASFFEELHGHPPYDWQHRLAENAIEGDWPGAVDLPTGSGKTACIDIAVFALAAQADRSPAERSAPRRIFFSVNRRVIVDEAFERSRRIANALWIAEQSDAGDKPALRQVAANLRRIAGTEPEDPAPPLDVLELRGGIYRDNRWARSVVQPTVVCTTPDQLGSRLLFRGYGVSSKAAPIPAALIAYDSLLFLDEAHISEPFRQTLENVSRFVDPTKWAERDIGVPPFTVVPMTATPNEAMQSRGVVRLGEADRANDRLKRRLEASKPATLRPPSKNLQKDVVSEATELLNNGPAAIGIIVNRVATAREIFATLEALPKETGNKKSKKPSLPEGTAIELVIGATRPIDRDDQARRLRALVGGIERPDKSEVSSIVVATQCLEVGADYDFDVLLTECASLDALRQRFGRLNRGGRPVEARASIFIYQKDVKAEDKLKDDKPLDPIYGNALARTWNWLTEAKSEADQVDFGIDAFTRLLKQSDDSGRIPAAQLPPSALLDAPVMMPAYVDLWCQTEPTPEPDPDVALFIHGPQETEPDVAVCWRADLINEDGSGPKNWCDTVALLPPTSAECLRLPISRVRRWLDGALDQVNQYADTLGQPEPDDGSKETKGDRPPLGVLWKGKRDSTLLSEPADLKPGSTLVLPADMENSAWLGHLPDWEQVQNEGETRTRIRDRAEQAFRTAKNRAAVRLHPALRHLYPADAPAIEALFQAASRHLHEKLSNDDWQGFIDAAADKHAEFSAFASLGNPRIELYPDRKGVVLYARNRLDPHHGQTLPTLDDEEDETSRNQLGEISLKDHTAHVVAEIEQTLALVGQSLPHELFGNAAKWHDLGKADERFQAMLWRGDRTDACLRAGTSARILAKSDGVPLSRTAIKDAYRRAGLPWGFRHEMLSMQLVEAHGLAAGEGDPELTLHLIAAHHGYARPFAPVVPDEELPAVRVDDVALTAAQRSELIPAHRLDSGVGERFWRLTRRYGWWGLAYLEALLRLADQRASAKEDNA
ncbi:type I-G CRISPR-associated helicase/endonuclease Cas3g [Stratiformator vulcanicus]|uniref:CRISPR-associated endonuclease/helicase Cas3 n=1 Tax=Stratiformator vulcanicus TaxID=2527980 RepID=A0A517QWR7_9PLAN|nr:type I-U CRISPR-associated helicase/endonuclease Cas3 [Stratiformator vulcanicus]QDT36037.1 CRISPR-associated endonuclease/helicase Cas3 [Stratiformator vulcanicus]